MGQWEEFNSKIRDSMVMGLGQWKGRVVGLVGQLDGSGTVRED